MITEMFQKQLEAEKEFIYANMPSFTETFFSELDKDLPEGTLIDYFITLEGSFYYIQRHYEDSLGGDQVQEVTLDISEYNKWWRIVSE